VTGNSAGVNGGGADQATLHNCTVISNSAGWYGGGVSGSSVHNSIVYFNRAPVDTNCSGATLEYSCATPLIDGAGNISADPLFVNTSAGDFRLSPGSPCIDTGTNDFYLLAMDIQGLPRVMDGNDDGIATVDMGAYEFNPYRFESELELSTNGFQFIIRGEPGKQVRIEASRDLMNWELVATVSLPIGGQTWTDPVASNEPFRFYRAIALR
jgi:hypothetical protein